MEFIFKSNNIKEGKVVKFNRNSDITKNMKLIEWMKNEILMSVSELFNILFKGVRSADEGLQDILANIIMITYLLAKRLGISFNEIDYKIKEKRNVIRIIIKLYIYCSCTRKKYQKYTIIELYYYKELNSKIIKIKVLKVM